MILLPVFFCLASAQELPQPQQLIQAANSAANLSGLRPYKLETSLVANRGAADEKRGRLTIFQDKDRSRSELEFDGYREVTVTLGNRMYVARNARARPVIIRLGSDYQFTWRVNLASVDVVRTSFVKEINGIQANCFGVIIEQRPRHYCFDPTKTILLESALTESKPEGKPIRETQYLDYQAMESKQFPTAIRHFFRGKSEGVDFEDVKLTRANLAPELFVPPQNAAEWDTCEDMQPARVVKADDPSYPIMAKLGRIQGDVYFSAIIGKDGKLHNIKEISRHPLLLEAAAQTIKGWRYAPAICGGNPIDLEWQIVVRFHM